MRYYENTENLLDNIMEAKQGWFTNHMILSRHAKLAWCFHLAEHLNVWIEFQKFNPLSGVVNEVFAELPIERRFNSLGELEAILVIWGRS